MRAIVVALTLVALLGDWLGNGRTAFARCPSDGMPTRAVCANVDAFFMPGLTGTMYLPNDHAMLGDWFGGGVQIVPFLWSHNTERYGPGQGKLLFDINVLQSTKPGL